MGGKQNINNNNNNVVKHPRVKFSSLEVEEEVYKEAVCNQQKLLKLGLIIIIGGLVVGGTSLGIGLYLLGKSAPMKLNQTTTTTITTTTTTTTESPQITTKLTPSTTSVQPADSTSLHTSTTKSVITSSTTQDVFSSPLTSPQSTTWSTTPTVSTSTLPPVSTSTLPPVSTSTLPPVSTSTLPPVSTSTLPPVSTSTLPPVSTSTLPPLEVSTPTTVDITVPDVTTASETTIEFVETTETHSYRPPDCLEKEFQCKSGECVKQSLVCNGKQDCHDSTDEHNCTVCRGFVCANGLCLPSPFSKCDGKFDCSDFSDEMNCGSRPGYKLCNNGVQIQSNKFCDKVDDCGDNSDEINCRCSGSRYSCPDGRCIMRSWMCDGHSDCSDGSDEDNCKKCDATQFQCTDYNCRNLTSVCDGSYDCPDGSDEAKCVNLGVGEIFRNLEIQIQDKKYLFCADDWNSDIGSRICQHQGYSNVAKANFLISFHDKPNWLKITDSGFKSTNQNRSFIRHFEPGGACASKKFVQLACQKPVCGERKVSFLQQFIAGGHVVPDGKWPWVVSVSYLGSDACGGALIAADWVVTAGHCVKTIDSFDYTSTPYAVVVTLGSVEWKKGTSVRVKKIIPHPGLYKATNGVVKNDIALLRLEHPVAYTDYIQPICYDSNEILTKTSFCYLAGWGLLSWRQYKPVEKLRETKMVIWDDARCSRNTVTGENMVDTKSTLCAGYLMGLPSGCQGDSGGPLMCVTREGHWNLGGVMSSGSSHCGRLAPGIRANRFMKIGHYKAWINDHIYNY